MMIDSNVVLAASLIAAAPGAQAQTSLHDIGRVMLPRMRELHVPTLSIAIIRGGAVVADTILSLDTNRRSGDAVFEAASLSKPVFASLVTLLADQGRFDLDRPLTEYAGWSKIDDPRSSRITGRMILSHTSGLRNASSGEQTPLAFDPGQAWLYSGDGYRRLQRVVEQLRGDALDAMVARAIFAPLGMQHSTFADSSGAMPNWAIGHDRAGRALPPRTFPRASASTSLRTSARDYAAFLLQFLGGGRTALPADVRAAMLTATTVADSSLDLRWGLGWALQRDVFFHWGSDPGFKSFVLGDRASGVGVVMLTDGDNGLELAPRLVKLVTGRDYSFFRFYLLHPTD